MVKGTVMPLLGVAVKTTHHGFLFVIFFLSLFAYLCAYLAAHPKTLQDTSFYARKKKDDNNANKIAHKKS